MTIAYSVFDDHDSASRHVAGMIASEVHRHGSASQENGEGQENNGVLGLATGSTPLVVYENLCRRYQSGELSFDGITTFNLDEYVGLPLGHPQSYLVYMRENLFKYVDLDDAKGHLPEAHLLNQDSPGAKAASAQRIAAKYEEQIEQSGGIAFQLLGIGSNGHIGFNEPGASIDSVTRLVDLAPSTVSANARFFESTEQVPKQAITMGIGTILRARQIVLLATGASKANAVAEAIQGPVSSDNPASFLQTHSNALIVLDREAASAIA